MDKPRYVELDGLRGVFSLMVVLFHYEQMYLPGPIYDFFLIRQSYLFVDYFFVLSGFVIVMNYDKLHSLSEAVTFIKKRIIRLYPLLFYTATVFLAYNLFSNLVLKNLFPGAFETQEYLAFDYAKYLDTLLFTNSTNILGSTYGMNYPSWSISAEIIAYLSFCVISLAATGKKRLMLSGLIILVCMYFGFVLDYFNISGSFGFLRGLLGFNLGILVWEISKKNFKLISKLDMVMFLLVLLSFYLLNTYDNSLLLIKIIKIVFIPLLFGGSILVLIKSEGLLGKTLSSDRASYLGIISYSVYLNHAFVVDKVPEISFKFLKLDGSLGIQLAIFLLTFLVVILYSGITYKVIERGGGKLLRKLLFRQTT